MPAKEKSYGSVTLSQEDYEILRAFAEELTERNRQSGNVPFKVSMSMMVGILIKYYADRRKSI